MQINKLITKVNYTPATDRKIMYIVVHYVGALGGAKANCQYYEKVNRNASAHYFVGHEGEVWQCVEDKDTAWHCGAKKYLHTNARNSNSIGVEMCVKKRDTSTMYASDRDWYFEEATVASTVELVRELMEKHDIPIENVIRHYDVTGKTCPAPYVNDENAWREFKNQLTVGATVKENPKNDTPTVKSVDVIAKEVIAGAWGNGSERKEKLTNAGYNYAEVQDRVNEILGCKKASTPASNLKSIDEIAREVIKGNWGNGSARVDKLTKAGYDAKAVQKRVNELLR